MNKRELWTYFDPPYDKYMISNYGRIKTKTGVIIKPDKHNGNSNTLTARLCVTKNGQRQVKRISIANQVYSYFAVNPPKYKNFQCLYIDGDKTNLYIDNLFCVLDERDEVQEWQEKVYVQNAYKNLYSLAKKKGLYKLKGFDVENCIGESALLVWKYLPMLQSENVFYSFCARYMQMCFLSQYRIWKNEKPFDPVVDEWIFCEKTDR